MSSGTATNATPRGSAALGSLPGAKNNGTTNPATASLAGSRPQRPVRAVEHRWRRTSRIGPRCVGVGVEPLQGRWAPATLLTKSAPSRVVAGARPGIGHAGSDQSGGRQGGLEAQRRSRGSAVTFGAEIMRQPFGDRNRAGERRVNPRGDARGFRGRACAREPGGPRIGRDELEQRGGRGHQGDQAPARRARGRQRPAGPGIRQYVIRGQQGPRSDSSAGAFLRVLQMPGGSRKEKVTCALRM